MTDKIIPCGGLVRVLAEGIMHNLIGQITGYRGAYYQVAFARQGVVKYFFPSEIEEWNPLSLTPEEIAAHKAKRSASEECSEPTLNEEEPRITFTVGGQEFFIGQRVWNTSADDGLFKLGAELEVCGSGGGTVIYVRHPRSHIVWYRHISRISTTPPAPHEWKRGDWVRHEDGSVFLVVHVLDEKIALIRTGFTDDRTLLQSRKDNTALTFITHTEIPE